jgi:hypothetical protein
MKNLVILLLLNALTLSAQPTIEWQKTFGGSRLDEAYGVQQTRDGGYIITGFTKSTDGDVTGFIGAIDFWVVKLNSTSEVEWKKTYGGTLSDEPFSIQQTEDEGYIIAGWVDSYNGDVTGHHGDTDAWLLKLTKTGDVQWQRCLGGSGWDEAWSARQTIDGGYIMAGRSNSTDGDVTSNHGGLDYWVVKLNEDGIIEWEKSFGGSKEDNGYSVKQALDGGYIVAGEAKSFDGDVTDHWGDMDYWIIKLSPDGTLEWSKSFGGTALDRCNNVYACSDGGCIVVGQISSIDGDIEVRYGGYDICAVKLSSTGEIEWQKTLGSSDHDWGRAVQQTTDGGYVVAGRVGLHDIDVVAPPGTASMWVVKLSPEGQIQWQKPMGGSMGEIANAIDQTTDGGYVAAGMTFSKDGDVTGHHEQSDFWIVKLSPYKNSGTFSVEAQALSLSPNPAGDYLTLQASAEETSLATNICDAQGRVLLQENVTNGSQLNVGALPSGLYFVRALGEGGAVYVGRFSRL